MMHIIKTLWAKLHAVGDVIYAVFTIEARSRDQRYPDHTTLSPLLREKSMSLRAREAAILSESRVVFHNSKLRLMEIMESSATKIAPRDGESTAYLPHNRVHVAILEQRDRRQGPRR